MPAKSAKQYRFMQMIAHGKKPRKGIGPSKEVARHFIEETSQEDRSHFTKRRK